MRERLVFENVGFSWPKVDFSLVARAKRRGVLIPENFPMAQAVCLLRNKRMTAIAMVNDRRLVAIMRI